MAYTEFYCQSNGSNLNAGSTTGTAGNGVAKYTSAGGNWANATRTFTPTDGSNPASSCAVGDMASVYVTAGATVATFIGRLTTVTNASNGTLVISSTASVGQNPSNGTGTMTIRVGGAWKGPNAGSGFPITFANVGAGTLSAAVNTSGDMVRVNFKNDATYSITAQVSGTSQQQMILLQGYTTTPGDGGKATIDGGGANISILTLGTGQHITDFVVSNVGVTVGTGTGLALATGGMATRAVVHDVRASGIVSGAGSILTECEVYAFNKGNGASSPGINLAGANNTVNRCYVHDGTGSNCDGILTGAGTCQSTIINGIFDTLGGNGITVNSSAATSVVDALIANNSFYNNTGAAIAVSGTAGLYYLHIENNIFTKNKYAVDGAASFTRLTGLMYNNVYGAGTEANGSGNYHTTGGLVLDDNTGTNSRVVLAANLSPYLAAGTGNFSLNEPTAEAIGRGAFTETDGTNTGTVSYPDAGAAQALITAGGGKSSHVFCG